MLSSSSPMTGATSSQNFPSSALSELLLHFNICICKELKFYLSHSDRVKWGNSRSVPVSHFFFQHPQLIGTKVNTRNSFVFLIRQRFPVTWPAHTEGWAVFSHPPLFHPCAIWLSVLQTHSRPPRNRKETWYNLHRALGRLRYHMWCR